VQWSANFSGDADAGTLFSIEVVKLSLTDCTGVIEDAKFKRREALADLAKAAGGSGTGKTV
jgi:hypothetical protein